MNKKLSITLSLLIFFMCFIFYTSSLPSDSEILKIEGEFFFNFVFSAELKHIIMYSILGFLSTLFFSAYLKHRTFLRLTSLSLFTPIFYGVTDELHQFFVPTRFCTLEDITADSIGSIIGVSLLLSYLAIKTKTLNKSFKYCNSTRSN